MNKSSTVKSASIEKKSSATPEKKASKKSSESPNLPKPSASQREKSVSKSPAKSPAKPSPAKPAKSPAKAQQMGSFVGKDSKKEVPETKQQTPPRFQTGLVYDERCLLHSSNTQHPERPARASTIAAKLREQGLFDQCVYIPSRPATEEELVLTHEAQHIEKIKKTVEQELDAEEQCEFLDGDTYFNHQTAFLAELAAGGLIELVDAVVTGRVQNGAAVIRPPGHHAECHKAMGFCFYNNVAVACNVIRKKHPQIRKIMIVDWDVHHGNGTQNMFYQSNEVLFFSIHRSDEGSFYPSTGMLDEVGEAAGRGFNINVPLPGPNLGDPEYLEVWNRLLVPVLREFSPDLILVSAGFDCALGDPLGGMEVSSECFAEMTRLLMENSNGKVVLALEGGYNVSAISDAMCCCVRSLLGLPVDPPSLNNPNISELNGRPKKYIEDFRRDFQRIREIQAEFWTSLRPDSAVRDVEAQLSQLSIENKTN